MYVITYNYSYITYNILIDVNLHHMYVITNNCIMILLCNLQNGDLPVVSIDVSVTCTLLITLHYITVT